jgi:hypothetical protein
MRFQLQNVQPTIFTFLTTDEHEVLRPGPFKWIGYQDTDHEWKDSQGHTLLSRDIVFQRWIYKESRINKMVVTATPSPMTIGDDRLYISGFCDEWISLDNAIQLQFLSDNRIYNEAGELLLRYVPEHNEWLSNDHWFRNYHFTSIVISSVDGAQ